MQKALLVLFPVAFFGLLFLVIFWRLGFFTRKKSSRIFTDKEKEAQFNCAKKEIDLRVQLYKEGHVK